MRVVISSDFYTPMINGVAVFSRTLAQGLAGRGHEVLVLAPSVSGEFHDGKEEGVRVVRLKSREMALYPDQINKADKKKRVRWFYEHGLHVSYAPYNTIRRILDEFKPDVIHNQTPGPVGLAVHKYARKRGVPIVATAHAYPDNLTSQLKWLRLVKRPTDAVVRKYFASFLRKADYATMPTQMAIDELVPKRVRGKLGTPVEAVSNGIDLLKYRAMAPTAGIYKKYGIPKDRLVVGYVGRVDPEKSLEVLVEAFARVAKEVPEAFLVIIGDGTDRVKLEGMARELGVADDARFLGRVVGEDKQVLYRTFDVFAITSETETQSIVLMEALATGLPAVAVRAGAVGELVLDGQNGFLCAPGDVSGVARGLVQILSDDKLRKRFGEESLKIVSEHDLQKILGRFEEIYRKII